jgi:hypothetical protein
LVPQVIAELKYGREDIMVVVSHSVTGLSILFDAGAVAVLVLEQNQRCCYKNIRILIGVDFRLNNRETPTKVGVFYL